MARKKTIPHPDLKSVNDNAAAIDIGSTMHMAAVNPEHCDAPIRAFGTFTHDLHDLAEWFARCGSPSVAMESTGVYWLPAFEIPEQHGFEGILVNPRYARNVPGRKTDVSDAAWFEHIFALTQSLEFYDFYQAKMLECDRRLEAVLTELAADKDHDATTLPRARTKTKQVNTPSFDVRAALYGVLGTDLTQIHGLGPSLALKLVGECGTDLKTWPSAKHFTSWLCLAPGNKISGGKILSSRTRRSSSRAAALLRLAAVTIGRSDTALGAFYRRLAARAGKAKAVTATRPARLQSCFTTPCDTQ